MANAPTLMPTRRTVVGGCRAADDLVPHPTAVATSTTMLAVPVRTPGPGRTVCLIHYFLSSGGASTRSEHQPDGFFAELLLLIVIFMIISYAATSGEAACRLAASCASAMTADSNACL